MAAPPGTRDHLRTEGGFAGRAMAFVLDRIDDADEVAAYDRARRLRKEHPDWTVAQLVEQLVKRKVQQTAAVGAAAAGSGLVPGIGTIAALTVGTLADLSATIRLQTELVLEIAAAHERTLSPEEKQRAVLLVAGLTAGGNRLVARGGARLSLQLTERFAQRWLARAVPFAGVAAAAGMNALSTYLIGRRADAYFAGGPEALGSWQDSLRTISGVDERVLTSWLADSTWRSPGAARARSALAGVARGARARVTAGGTRARSLFPGQKKSQP